MLNTIKILMTLLIFILLMPFGSTPSYAWEHGGGGGFHGGRGYGNFGLGLSYSPYYYPGYYDPSYYPYYYNSGILVSSPVVETPEVTVQPSTTVITTAPTYPTTEITSVSITNTDNTDNAITINIPNASAGYTSVLIKRSGNGFVGPQGEFYPDFPKVSQLKLMYGK